MVPIILIGGGGHCLSCIDIVEETGKYNILGILDVPEKHGKYVLNYEIIGSEDNIDDFVKKCSNYLITVGQIKSSALREKLYQIVKMEGGELPVIISPSAKISKHSEIGEGTIIMHNAFVNSSARIGICSIINSKALVEHEAVIGDFCHISTSSVINGQAEIGSRCFIGSNSVVANNVKIVPNTIISAGSVVLKDISYPGTYIGSPLRKIK